MSGLSDFSVACWFIRFSATASATLGAGTGGPPCSTPGGFQETSGRISSEK
jgi:hypothetical protein